MSSAREVAQSPTGTPEQSPQGGNFLADFFTGNLRFEAIGPHPFTPLSHPSDTSVCYVGCRKDKDDPIHAGFDKWGRRTDGADSEAKRRSLREMAGAACRYCGGLIVYSDVPGVCRDCAEDGMATR